MIRSQNLRFAHPGGAPLAFADLHLPAGGVLLLSGPSGSGKSTWLALVAGLLRPAVGQLWVAGQDMGQLAPHAADAWRARHIGFLPQQVHLSPALSVADNLALAYWALGRRADPARVQSVLDALDVGELAQRRPDALSGGQAQRVALARAVLLEPALLLADEPTASLDDAAAHEALALLRRLARQRAATLVLATHDSRVLQAWPHDPQDAAVQHLVWPARGAALDPAELVAGPTCCASNRLVSHVQSA